ncbi:alpha/beta hydrolase [Arenimonas sp.]|uniref:alpha/beta hydrolase n=1 Tax=Arenimonas sp. TaxID=1872635 RepID=UPI0025C20AA2|nr:alpha/beta hydrolase [Arenimonas sp.]
MRMLIALLTCLILGGCSGAYYRAINLGVDDDRIASETYDTARGLALDVHRPIASPGAVAPPVVVFVHGGSWRDGDREGYRFVGQRLAREGALVLVPDYRKAPEHAFPDFMYDTARAVAWARANAQRLGGDPARVFVMGHSAGAHIVALLATDPRYLASVDMVPRDLAGVVALAGPYDFLPLTDPDLWEVFGEKVDWPLSQPVNFADGDEPPFLLIHGRKDRIVWAINSERLQAKLQAAGSSSRYVPVDGEGHIGLLLSLRRKDPSPALTETTQFLGLP